MLRHRVQASFKNSAQLGGGRSAGGLRGGARPHKRAFSTSGTGGGGLGSGGGLGGGGLGDRLITSRSLSTISWGHGLTSDLRSSARDAASAVPGTLAVFAVLAVVEIVLFQNSPSELPPYLTVAEPIGRRSSERRQLLKV
eukprot:COSAG05_NODE_890_length_6734_cov_2.541824_2_plen_140_part_00